MVSTTEVGGGGKTPNNGPTAKKNQSKPNNKKPVGFKGDAKVESVVHGKVITSESNQAGQIVALVANLSSFIGDKSFPHWAKTSQTMLRKTRDDFMPADIGTGAYGTLVEGVFVWNKNTLDTEDKYNRDMKVWDNSVTSGINQ